MPAQGGTTVGRLLVELALQDEQYRSSLQASGAATEATAAQMQGAAVKAAGLRVALTSLGQVASGVGALLTGAFSVLQHLPALISLVGKINTAFRGTDQAAKQVAASEQAAATSGSKLGATFKALAAAVAGIGTAAAAVWVLKRALDGGTTSAQKLIVANRGAASAGGALKEIGGALLSSLGPAVLALKALDSLKGGFKAVVGGAVETGAQFETLRGRLTTLLGTTEAAQARMDELFQIAATTPFELPQLVEAEATMEAFGIQAPKWRGAVMDLAAAMGLDLNEAASAVGRAFAGGAGAADILRERGVLTMARMRAGTDLTKLSLEDFRDVLFQTLTAPATEGGRFAGGMSRLATTFTGRVSSLRDEWTKFQKQIADAAFFDSVRGLVDGMLSEIARGTGEVTALATGLGETLTASLMLAVKVAGGLVDGFDLVRFSIALVETAYQATVAGMLRSTEGLLDALLQVNGALGDPLKVSGKLTAAWQSVGTSADEYADAAKVSAEETNAIFTSLGRGGESAERLVKSMEAAQSRGRALAKAMAAPSGVAGSADDASKAAKKLEDGLKDLEATTRRLLAPDLDRLGELNEHLRALMTSAALSQANLARLADDIAAVMDAIGIEEFSRGLERAADAANEAFGEPWDEAVAGLEEAVDQMEALADAQPAIQFADQAGIARDELDGFRGTVASVGGTLREFFDSIDRPLTDTVSRMDELTGAWDRFAAAAGASVKAVSSALGALGDLVSAVTGGFDFSIQGLLGAAVEAAGGGRAAAKENRAALKEAQEGLAEAMAEGEGVAEARKAVRQARRAPLTEGAAAEQAIQQEVNKAIAFVSAVAENLDVVLQALVDAVPVLLDAVIDALPDLVSAVVKAIPELIAAIITRLPEIIVALLAGLLDGLKAIFESLFDLLGLEPATATTKGPFAEERQALEEAKATGDVEAIQEAREALREARADYKRRVEQAREEEQAGYYLAAGDTPGPVRAGSRGLFARFAPGDLVVAAQRPADLLMQALSAAIASRDVAPMAAAMSRPIAGPSPVTSALRAAPSAPTVVSLTVAAEGRTLDGVLVRAGQRGAAPHVQRALRRSAGVRIGIDRGPLAFWRR